MYGFRYPSHLGLLPIYKKVTFSNDAVLQKELTFRPLDEVLKSDTNEGKLMCVSNRVVNKTAF